MNTTTILTVTHKKFDSNFLPQGYQVICVGNKEQIWGGSGVMLTEKILHQKIHGIAS